MGYKALKNGKEKSESVLNIKFLKRALGVNRELREICNEWTKAS